MSDSPCRSCESTRLVLTQGEEGGGQGVPVFASLRNPPSLEQITALGDPARFEQLTAL